MANERTMSGRAWSELFLIATIWGGSFLSVRIALNDIAFPAVVAHRVFWAAVALWVWVLARRLPLPKGWRVWRAFFVMGLLNNVLPFSLLAWGQQYVATGLTSVLNASTAVFAPIVAAIFLSDEQLSRRKALGTAVGFSGVVVAIGPGVLTGLDLTSLGQLAFLGSSLCYALAGVWGRVHLSHLRPEVAAAGMLTVSSTIAVPAALLFSNGRLFPTSPEGLLATGYISLVATALAFLVFWRVMAMAGVANLLLVTMLIPPIAIALGAAVLGETLAPSAYGGFLLLALGLVIIDGRLVRRVKQRLSSTISMR